MDPISGAYPFGRPLSRRSGDAVALRARRCGRGDDAPSDRADRLPTEAAAITRRRATLAYRSDLPSLSATAIRSSMRDPNRFSRTLPAQARAQIEDLLRKPLSPKEYITLVDEVAPPRPDRRSMSSTAPTGYNGAAMRSSRRLRKPSSAPVANPHASSGDAISACLGRRDPSRRRSSNTSIAFAVLSPRLTLAHCVWTRPDELELLSGTGHHHRHEHQFQSPPAIRHGSGRPHGRSGPAHRHRPDSSARSTTMTMPCASCGSGISCTWATPIQGNQLSRAADFPAAFTNGRLSVTNKDDGGGHSRRLRRPTFCCSIGLPSTTTGCATTSIARLVLVLTHHSPACSRTHHRRPSVVKDGTVVGVDADAARAEVMGRVRHAMPDKASLATALPLLEQAIAKRYEPNAVCF